MSDETAPESARAEDAFTPGPTLDLERCDELVRRHQRGDVRALDALVEYLWPFWGDLARRSRVLGPLRRSDDAVRDVQTRLVEKLHANERRALGQYVVWSEQNREKTFEDWMRIVATNVIRSYMRRELAEGRTIKVDGDPTARRILSEFFVSVETEEPGFRPPVTPAQTAKRLLEYARERLPAAQWTALASWLQGAEFEEIAEEQPEQLADPDAARRTVRAALATLRRRFADEATT